MYLEKKFFLKLILISFQTKKNYTTFKAQLGLFFQKYETTFFKKFCIHIFFIVFCARLQNRTQKSYWKPNSSVLLSTSWILQLFIHFWAFLLLYTVFRDSEVCLVRCDSYGDFGYLTKDLKKLFEEKLVKEHIVLLL